MPSPHRAECGHGSRATQERSRHVSAAADARWHLSPARRGAFGQGNSDEALKIFEKARAIDLRLLARHPDDPAAQRLLALSQFRYRTGSCGHGPESGSDRCIRRSIEDSGRALRAIPGAGIARARRRMSRMNLARLIENGDGKGRAEMQHAVETFRSLARLDPRNVAATRDLLAALVAAGDIAARSDASAARENYLEALRIAEMLDTEPFVDAQAQRDIRVVRARLDAPAVRSTIPELKLAVVRNGREVVDNKVGAAALGEDLRLSLGTSGADAQYLLVMGGTGRARLFSRDEVAAALAGENERSAAIRNAIAPDAAANACGRGTDALVERVSRTSGPREIHLTHTSSGGPSARDY